MVHETAGPDVMLALAIVKTLIFVVGGLITFFAFKAYRRTESRALGLLTVGFGTVTVGALLGGMTYEILGVALPVGIVVESVFVFIGFCLIAISLRVDR